MCTYISLTCDENCLDFGDLDLIFTVLASFLFYTFYLFVEHVYNKKLSSFLFSEKLNEPRHEKTWLRESPTR